MLVNSEEWDSYHEDDVGKAQHINEIILNDIFWVKIDRILSFTNPIYDMLREADTDIPTLHLIYDMWDTMVEKVKTSIYRLDMKDFSEDSSFHLVVYKILVDKWNKSNTLIHYLAHSLNPRYYSREWLGDEASRRVPPYRVMEISNERNNFLIRFFPKETERNKVVVSLLSF